MITPGSALPVETVIALALVVDGPLLATVLYLIDRRNGDGSVTVAGHR